MTMNLRHVEQILITVLTGILAVGLQNSKAGAVHRSAAEVKSGSVEQTPTQWIKYTSPAGRYSVLFPCQPKLSSDDSKFVIYSADCHHDPTHSLYYVDYFDIGPDMTYSLDKGVSAEIAAVKGTLVAKKTISLDGYPGLEVKFSAEVISGIDIVTLARHYQVGRRVYTIKIKVTKFSETFGESETSLSGEMATKFFDSFQLVKAP